MTKREALEKCMDQWQRIYTELSKMDAAAADGEPFQISTFNTLKCRALRNAGVSDNDYPINSCYMCEYVQTEHPVPDTKLLALRNAGVSDDDFPINSCYMCEYVQTEHPVPDTKLLACEYCPLKGYAWEQCEMDGSYLACEDEYESDRFGDAADYALEICVACERALEYLDNEE